MRKNKKDKAPKIHQKWLKAFFLETPVTLDKNLNGNCLVNCFPFFTPSL